MRGNEAPAPKAVHEIVSSLCQEWHSLKGDPRGKNLDPKSDRQTVCS